MESAERIRAARCLLFDRQGTELSQPPSRRKKTDRTILLKDLVPRADPKGGAGGKTVFGQIPPVPEPDDRWQDTPKSPRGKGERDGSPKKER